MGDTYTRVAAEGSLASMLFWACMVLVGGVGFYRCRKNLGQPWSLLVLTLGISVLACTSIPSAVWIGREALFVCLVAFVVFCFEMRAVAKTNRKWNPLGLVGLFPIVLSTWNSHAYGGTEYVQVLPDNIACTGGIGGGGIIDKDSSPTWFSDNLHLDCRGDSTEIRFADWYRNESGRYLTGLQVANMVREWIARRRAAEKPVDTIFQQLATPQSVPLKHPVMESTR